jgi:hypothetical protein
MTLGVIGVALLVLVAYMCWRGGGSWGLALAAVLLGVVIAGSNGPLGTFAHTALAGLSTAGTALVQMIDSKK